MDTHQHEHPAWHPGSSGTGSTPGGPSPVSPFARPAPNPVSPPSSPAPPAAPAGLGPYPSASWGPGPRAGSPPVPRSSAPAGTVTARVLAVTGGAVTLLGVVLLLVLAARSGWFPPVVRVLAGAGLGVGLVGAGVRVHQRPAGAVGGIALVATGIAALALDTAAASTLYAFLPVGVAMGLVAAVLDAGLALAAFWNHRSLALGAVAGSAVLAPLVVQDFSATLIALLTALLLPAGIVATRCGWPSVVLTAAGVTVPAALITVVDRTMAGSPHPLSTVVAVAAVALVGLGTAVTARGRLAVAPRGALLIVTVVSLLPALRMLDRGPGAVAAAGAAVLLLAVGLVLRRYRDDADLGTVVLAAGAVVALDAAALALGGRSSTGLLLALVALLAVLAGRGGGRGVLVAAGAVAPLAVLVALTGAADPSLVTLYDGPPPLRTLIDAVEVSVLVTAAACCGLDALARLGLLRTRTPTGWAAGVLALLALYGSSGAVVSLALTVSPTHAGFLTGHVLVTVAWTAVALLLLLHGLRDAASRALGGVLIVAAVVKLVLFDLVSLDGIARVVVFLAAGLVMLAAGSRYARVVAPAGEAATGPIAVPARPEGMGG